MISLLVSKIKESWWRNRLTVAQITGVYIFTSQGDRTYRRVRYNDPAVDNLLEIVSNEL